MSSSGKAGFKLDDAALVDELRRFSEEAAGRYLQHVVVSKKSANKKLHKDLLDGLLFEAEQQVRDDGVKYHLQELGTCDSGRGTGNSLRLQTRSIDYWSIHNLTASFWLKLRQRRRSSQFD